MTPRPPTITRVSEGAFLVEAEGRQEIVYIAGTPAARWVFWNGRTYLAETGSRNAAPHASEAGGPTRITAPMPARVTKILVKQGAAVRKGDTLLVLEAMKMEQPIRAHVDAVVAAVHCTEGEL